MVDLGASQFRSMIENEFIIKADPNLTQNIGKYITIYSDKSQDLQYLYVGRHILMYQLRRAAEYVDIQNGPDRVAASQNFKALRTMLLDINVQIAEKDTDANVPVIGSTTPTHYNLFNDSCGIFDILGWPNVEDCFWDAEIKMPC